MARGFDLKWNGQKIVNKYREAQKSGVAEVATLCVREAAKRPPHPYVTGLAQSSLRAEPPRIEGRGVSTRWGSFDVNYYIFIELRLNLLRNAADKNYPKLGKAIAGHRKRLGGIL